MSSADPGERAERYARQALADALDQGGPIGTGVEAAQAMRAALRDVWALAQCWGEYPLLADVQAAIRGYQQPGPAADVLDEDAPFRGGGVRPGE